MLTAVALKIVIFMLVDANCDDSTSVTIPRCPNLVVHLKVSVALEKNFHTLIHAFHAPPSFKSRIHPCSRGLLFTNKTSKSNKAVEWGLFQAYGVSNTTHMVHIQMQVQSTVHC